MTEKSPPAALAASISGASSATALRERLRQDATALRAGLSKNTVATLSARIGAHLLATFPAPPGRVISFFWPLQNEPDLRMLLSRWQEQGARLALPVVAERDAALKFRCWRPEDAMVPDACGIPAPGAGDFVLPEALLIPLNAFDSQGFRLGYGGGYFDRTLASLRPAPLAIGVGFEINRVPTTRPQTHDVRLDWIVTEAGATRTPLAG